MKALIIYFSRADENYAVGYIDKGNTEIAAEFVQELTGADMFKVEPAVPYAADYKTCIEEAKKRIGNAPIKEKLSDISAYDAAALGCPAMGAEELEDSEFLPMLESIEPALAGKKVVLFGSYGWGDGEWMRSWEARCAEKGIALAAESVMANEAPDDAATASCKALGEALA